MKQDSLFAICRTFRCKVLVHIENMQIQNYIAYQSISTYVRIARAMKKIEYVLDISRVAMTSPIKNYAIMYPTVSSTTYFRRKPYRLVIKYLHSAKHRSRVHL